MRSSLISKRYLIILLAGLLLSAMSAFGESAFVTKGSKAASLDSCVAPTNIMRRNHMDFLKHGRDDTVRDGVRGLEYSLSECIDCHASTSQSGKAMPVDAKGEFCQ
ncbi:MAG: sulfur reduction protein DsrJ, partial [Candidatus Thiodiazotropha sp. (ex Notomyrtea botanica)]|nr:sulfur reduction protein DsrJ [Candidatus Thiodiazotropha sp. (ex Notomyrtea botanica)]